MGSKRRRVKHTLSLEERLARRANELRERALTLQPGTEKEALLKLARRAQGHGVGILTPERWNDAAAALIGR